MSDTRTDNFIEIWKQINRLQSERDELIAAAKAGMRLEHEYDLIKAQRDELLAAAKKAEDTALRLLYQRDALLAAANGLIEQAPWSENSFDLTWVLALSAAIAKAEERAE